LLIPAGARHAARNVGGTTARGLGGYRRGSGAVESAAGPLRDWAVLAR
jgi:hypothetical protein